MGFFSGAPEVFRRRKAEAAIQTQFELCRNMGVSLGRPATLAGRSLNSHSTTCRDCPMDASRAGP